MTATAIFAAKLEALETDTKRDFLSLLENPEIDGENIDPPTFSRLLRFAHFYGIAAGEFCTEFGVTLSTVSRWRTDVAYPGMYIRIDVLKFIRGRMHELNMAA